MHSRLEIIMPPTEDIKSAVSKILEPFSENCVESDECECHSYQFWDFWVIGGRFSGSKIADRLGKEKIELFYKELTKQKIMVSGIQFGKQKIATQEQINLVDQLWRDYFPESGVDVCPFFNHSNDQYDSSLLFPGDICEMHEVIDFKCERLIFAGLDYNEKHLQAKWMISRDMWNGVNYQKIEWDGSFKEAVTLYFKLIKNYSNEYRDKFTPKKDWLVVTVDYHT